MNRNTLKPRILLFIILIFSVCAVNALTLNPLIEAPDGHTLINQKPLLFNEQIIFVTEQNDDYTLWAYDLSDHSYTTLHTFEDYFYPKFYVMGGYFYFKDNFFTNLPHYNRLWKSDGTPLGTKSVDGAPLHKTPMYQKGNLIFARSALNEQMLTVYDGHVIENQLRDSASDFDTSMPNLACGFGVRDFIYPVYLFYSNQISLVRYHYNNAVDYSESLPVGFELDEDLVWYYEDTCLYHIDAQQFSDILVIPEQDDHYFLGEQLGFSEVNYLTRFKNHYYMIAYEENGGSQLVKLSSDLSKVEKQVEFGFYLGIMTLTVSNEYLIAYAHSGPTASPPAWTTSYYDENLNKILGLGGPFTDVPEVYPRDGGETVVINHYTNGLNLKTLTTDITNQSPGLDLNQNELINIITDEDKTETFALIKDLRSGQSSIKTLEAVPDMGALSVGNWFDPDYQNQGMSIVEGLRDDGSRYLFVTLYLFRDGQPLWLAGTSNINYPQPTLDIELGEYSGLGLWQADTPAQVEKFADMTLSMDGCHQMMMNLETMDGQTFNIALQRMVNNDINQFCKD
ncbi:hypothetical protein [Marinicella gelatinilytica]|uniref:hypothetical protein n=1 Tax=Marinicella gelatinilytica TaxID=2996017 RepID=UPI002260FA17|nr:hypothetical protein [Marinicella gelatinilytica]MCX7545919.1 hypothetical protein [Marinicella gelatinilytica]